MALRQLGPSRLASCGILPLYGITYETALSNFRSYHLEAFCRARVLDAAHASDQVERVPVQFAVFKMGVIDVN